MIDRCALERLGSILSGFVFMEDVVKRGAEMQINFLELLAVKLALLTASKKEPIKYILFQIDSNKVLSNLLKLGDTSPTLLNTRREIWNILLLKKEIEAAIRRKISQKSQQNTSDRVSNSSSGVFLWIFRHFEENFFTEHLLTLFLTKADLRSRNNQYWPEWKSFFFYVFNFNSFLICWTLEQPRIDFFDSRLSNHSLIFPWKPNSHSQNMAHYERCWSLFFRAVLLLLTKFSFPEEG